MINKIIAPRADDLYIEDYSTSLWYRTGHRTILVIFESKESNDDHYEMECIYDEEDLLFEKSIISGHFMVVPFAEDDCFLFLDVKLEIKKSKIFSVSQKYGKIVYKRYSIE